MQYSNPTNLPITLAVFLAHDDYSLVTSPSTFSATGLLKNAKQTVLASRVKGTDASVSDLESRRASTIGTAIHNGLEHAFLSSKLPATLASLGLPEKVIKRFKVNPTEVSDNTTDIVVYTELRTNKELIGYTVSGECDFVCMGTVRDLKTTGSWKIGKALKEVGVHRQCSTPEDMQRNCPSLFDWVMQLSIYRWLMPNIITEDEGAIDYIITDWSKLSSIKDKTYPPSAMGSIALDLFSEEVTELWIKRKLETIKKYWNSPEEDMPSCTDEELWSTAPRYKYYRNKEKLARASRVYDTPQEANAHMVKDGNTGVIIPTRKTVRYCSYCNSNSVCKQYQQYREQGCIV